MKLYNYLSDNLNHPMAFAGFFLALHREDLVYADSNLYRFTSKAKDGYTSFSDVFRQRYPGYLLDATGSVYA